jgi:DNA-binding NarL/FixJ family response regulator
MADVAAPRTPRFTVVIADDDEYVRIALRELIEDHPGLVLVAAADSGITAAQLCRAHQPDLGVIDVMMPNGGVDAVLAIREVSPRTVVVAYTARSDRRTRERLLASGAAAVFAKGYEDDLAGALYRLLAGGSPPGGGGSGRLRPVS